MRSKYIVGSDEHQCYNHNEVMDGVTLTSSPYIGEFTPELTIWHHLRRR